MRKIFSLLAALVLGGCGGMSVANDYNWDRQSSFTFGGTSWVVVDKPKESRLLLRPSIGESLSLNQQLAPLGLTDGVQGQDEAIAAWFKSKGRNCKITKTQVVAASWRQYFYSCS